MESVKVKINECVTIKLTVFGKVYIINSLAIPKFLYTGSILNVPGKKYILKKYSLLYNFIGNKRDRINSKNYLDRQNPRCRRRYNYETKINKRALDKSHFQKKSSSLAILDSLCKEKHLDFEHFYKINVTKNDYQYINICLFSRVQEN